MIIELTKFIESLSVALDYAEKALFSIQPFHALRVAVLANRMADFFGLDAETKYLLTQAAMLHDCALAEYLNDEASASGETPNELDMAAHCRQGEEIVCKLPPYERIRGAVLYHHERTDGKGAFGLQADEIPLCAQLIHIADAIDVHFDLYTSEAGQYKKICAWVRKSAGTVFSEKCALAFLHTVDDAVLQSITGERCQETLRTVLPSRMLDVSVEILREMASVFANITDYKSHFTWRHSMGIAEKAEAMGKYYGAADEECNKLFIAGALHDIGKLLISNDILEKPAKLSPEEYKEIQNHALGTWDLLWGITGLEDITQWAALHHEKLNGTGYPFGYCAEQLDRNARLLACLDVYQALVEDRPYKAGMSHGEAMSILKKMGAAGQLDEALIADIEICFATPETTDAGWQEIADVGLTYRCPVCGYVHKGTLPENFICPQCRQPGSIFEKL